MLRTKRIIPQLHGQGPAATNIWPGLMAHPGAPEVGDHQVNDLHSHKTKQSTTAKQTTDILYITAVALPK